MGRRRLENKFIVNDGQRRSVFRNRIGGLKKKARTLSLLCNVVVTIEVRDGERRIDYFDSGHGRTEQGDLATRLPLPAHSTAIYGTIQEPASALAPLDLFRADDADRSSHPGRWLGRASDSPSPMTVTTIQNRWVSINSPTNSTEHIDPIDPTSAVIPPKVEFEACPKRERTCTPPRSGMRLETPPHHPSWSVMHSIRTLRTPNTANAWAQSVPLAPSTQVNPWGYTAAPCITVRPPNFGKMLPPRISYPLGSLQQGGRMIDRVQNGEVRLIKCEADGAQDGVGDFSTPGAEVVPVLSGTTSLSAGSSPQTGHQCRRSSRLASRGLKR